MAPISGRSRRSTGAAGRCSAAPARCPATSATCCRPLTVDELIAERGVRAPFIRVAKAGDVLARDCYLGSGRVRRRDAGPGRLGEGARPSSPPARRSCCRDCTGCGRRSSTSSEAWSTTSVTPCRPTPTSRRRGNRGFDPHYDVHDVFVLQAAGQKRWTVHEPVHETRCRPSRGPTTATPSPRESTTTRHRRRPVGR